MSILSVTQNNQALNYVRFDARFAIATTVNVVAMAIIMSIMLFPPLSAAIGVVGTVALFSAATTTIIVNSTALTIIGSYIGSEETQHLTTSEPVPANSPVPQDVVAQENVPEIVLSITVGEAENLQQKQNVVHGFLCNGMINGKCVVFYISSNQWNYLKITDEERVCGQINLANHIQDFQKEPKKPFTLMHFGNGIKTSCDRFGEINQLIANNFNGPFLLFSLYNPSHGLRRDLVRTYRERHRKATAIVRKMREFMVWLSNQIDESTLWLGMAHSENGVITKRAIEGMTEDQQCKIKEKLHIFAAGPAEPLAQTCAAKVKNVYSDSDYVAGCRTPWGCCQKFKAAMDYKIKFLKSKCSRHNRRLWFIDHSFSSPTYQSALWEWVAKRTRLSEKLRLTTS